MNVCLMMPPETWCQYQVGCSCHPKKLALSWAIVVPFENNTDPLVRDGKLNIDFTLPPDPLS